jgi:hypothetical protein
MKRPSAVAAGLGFALIAAVLIISQHSVRAAELRAYRISVRYEKSQFGETVEALGKDVEAPANYFAARLPFPRPLEVVVKDCGVVNAFYDPRAGNVTVCYDLLSSTVDNALRIFPRELAPKVFHDAVIYVLGHELAHAFIHLAKVKTSGPSEDTADELAAYLTDTDKNLGGFAAIGALAFHLKDSPDDEDVWDVHAPPRRRIAALACLTYGSDPAGARGFLQNIGKVIGEVRGLDSRAETCEGEWRRVSGFWRKYVRDLSDSDTIRWLDPTPTGRQTLACPVDCGEWCCPAASSGCGDNAGECRLTTSASLSWSVKNACGKGSDIAVRIFDTTNNVSWPTGDRSAYVVSAGDTRLIELPCVAGATVCYGARIPGSDSYWGVDIDQTEMCKDCCSNCGSPLKTLQFTCHGK